MYLYPLEARHIVTCQARCLLLLGNFNLAQKVAHQILQQSPGFSKALLVQGEAFYNSCNFEHALRIFYRGSRLATGSKRFHMGIKKCIKTLQNIVSSVDIFCFKGIATFVKTVKTEIRKDPNFLDKLISGKQTMPKPVLNDSSTSGKLLDDQNVVVKKVKKKEKGLVEDRKYLSRLMKIMEEKNGSRRGIPARVSAQANQALEFIDGRSSFWEQTEN